MRKLVVLAAGVVFLFLQASATFAMSTEAKVGECIRRCYFSFPNRPYPCITDCILTDGTHNPRNIEAQPLAVKPEVFSDIKVGHQADLQHKPGAADFIGKSGSLGNLL
jgi:hypothetical protein